MKHNQDSLDESVKDSVVDADEPPTRFEKSTGQEMGKPHYIEEKSRVEENGNETRENVTFKVHDLHLYKASVAKEECLANFDLKITAQHEWLDEDDLIKRIFTMELRIKNKAISFQIPSEAFNGNKLRDYIVKNAGSEAIVYGKLSDLRIGVQELSKPSVITNYISMGFTKDGNFVGPGIYISKNGVVPSPNIEVDLTAGNFAKNIRFSAPDLNRIKDLVSHLHQDFLQLKSHETMFPLMGHIVMAAFASRIGRLEKQKPIMHLQGPSGGGKTFLANLAASFYGNFADNFLSWSSTANAIEVEGALFRDALLLIDDLKASTTKRKKVIRIIQNAADSKGRARLQSGLSDRIKNSGIRGLILSTGEDFVFGEESILGRTLFIQVEPENNANPGAACWNRRLDYNMFIPGLLQWLLMQEDWFKEFCQRVSERSKNNENTATYISNGMRVANNWALNGTGFELFVRYSRYLGTIGDQHAKDLLAEYDQIVKNHIAQHINRLIVQNPIEVFFQVLSEQFATEIVRIKGLPHQKKGRVIGKVMGDNVIVLFPGETFRIIHKHFRGMGHRSPFTKETFRDALKRENLLILSEDGRIAQQVRHNGSRLQAWKFAADDFKSRCGIMSF